MSDRRSQWRSGEALTGPAVMELHLFGTDVIADWVEDDPIRRKISGRESHMGTEERCFESPLRMSSSPATSNQVRWLWGLEVAVDIGLGRCD